MKTTIGVDAFPLNKLNGGISYYIFYLLDELIRKKSDSTFILYAGSDQGDIKYFSRYSNVIIKKISSFKFSHTLWRLLSLTYMLFCDKVDIFWGTTQFIPLIRRKKLKTILTLYDFVYLFSANSMTFLYRNYFKLLMPLMIKQADFILPISLGTGKRLKFLYGRDHHGILYPPMRPEMSSKDSESVIRKIEKHGLIYNQYFVTVGTMEPRKNFIDLIEIYLKILHKNPDKTIFPLVIVGGGGWKNNKIHQILDQAKQLYPDHVKILGFISDEDLPYLLSGANRYITLSLYEGYGMPLAEARQCGTPVVCRNITEMKEASETDGIFLKKRDLESQLEKVFVLTCLNNRKKERFSTKYATNEQKTKILVDLIDKLQKESL